MKRRICDIKPRFYKTLAKQYITMKPNSMIIRGTFTTVGAFIDFFRINFNCSHCFMYLALPGKRPVVVISCRKSTYIILITETFFFYFLSFRNNRPKITTLPIPGNSTNILPLRPRIHLPFKRRTARHGIRRNSGRVNRSPK